jgi:PAS domain S-box-containing protein
MSLKMKYLGRSFVSKLIIVVGITLLFCILILEIFDFRNSIIAWAIFSFLLIASILFLFVMRFIKGPIEKIIAATEHLARGNYSAKIELAQTDELGKLSQAINNMGKTIGEKQAAINKQRNEYQRLFEMVPCIITVQDKNYRMISYNRQFAENFNPKPGDYCYCAYKARDEKCESCPVEKTFKDGQSHSSYETAVHPDGSTRHWVARTSPIVNEQGEVVAAMEMSLDITHRKLLQEALEKSEKKYFAIFENIPNPVFVLEAISLEVLDCNSSVLNVYGYTKDEIRKHSFMSLFNDVDKDRIKQQILNGLAINQVKQIKKDGSILYANIRVSPSEFPGKKVYLVTTSDITQWLETEQQLIQAGKMATLGEMATGVAHELNQPLSVIKTASGFFMKKLRRNEPITDDTLNTLAEEIDIHVDRAAKIINHMREFGRKSDEAMAAIQIEDTLRKAFELFSKQLELREIEVVWQIEEDLPPIMADPSRLEQVFINLLINARDAMEDKWATKPSSSKENRIVMAIFRKHNSIMVEVSDTGPGISKNIAEKIFEPFFTTKKVGKGTGLGLSISYSIIKEFGGTIDVVSKKEEGACFRLTFPIPQEQGAPE